MSTKDGGPAFPRIHRFETSGPYGSSGKVTEAVGGMSLRDWFAGQALAGLMPGYTPGLSFAAKDSKWVAMLAYEMADAMLAARSKQEGGE